MSELDVAAIRARAEAATPGPWTYTEDEPTRSAVANVDGRWIMSDVRPSDDTEEDADFIAHAPADIAALLDALAAARAEVERLTEWWCNAETASNAARAREAALREAVEGLADEHEAAWRNSWYRPQEDEEPPPLVKGLRAVLAAPTGTETGT